MIPLIGLLLLYSGITLAAISLISLFQKKQFPLYPASLLTIGSTLFLIITLITRDYQLLYTTQQISNDLPLPFRIAALWGGESGSLLFWCMVLSGYTLFLKTKKQSKHTHLIIAGSLLFFQLMVLYLNNPFTPLPPEMPIPDDGTGMNPQLRTTLMLLHPPLLYLGYIAFNISGGFAMGSLLKDPDSNSWIKQSLPFTLAGWIFLGAGNLTGMLWAYVELGWGGFWAWDPVENASLMPWLTATALLFALKLYQYSKKYHSWCYILTITTFLLTIFGTFITRSGLINSIHAFAKSKTGYYLLGFIVILAVAMAVAMIRWQKPENIEQKSSKVVQFQTWITILIITTLLLILAIVFTGTIFPPIFAMIGKKIDLSTDFFNKTLLPFYYLFIFLLIAHIITQLKQKKWNILISAGILVMLLGISGASKQQSFPLHLALNDPIKPVPGIEITLLKNDLKRGDSFDQLSSTILIKTEKKSFKLTPTKRLFHHKRGGDRTVVDLRSTITEDHYCRLRKHTTKGGLIDYYINPLMIWVWIGGVLMLLGGVIQLVYFLGFSGGGTPLHHRKADLKN